MAHELLAKVRAAVRAEMRESIRQSYSDEVQRLVATFAVRERAAGASWQHLGALVGMNASTVARYTRRFEELGEVDAGSTPRMLPVTVTLPAPAPALVLVSPTGYRLEGLDIETAAALLGRLR